MPRKKTIGRGDDVPREDAAQQDLDPTTNYHLQINLWERLMGRIERKMAL